MNIFVASWFFPPATSSEGIVTYKLLRNSKYHYDVFSSTSRQWGYQKPMQRVEDQNLTCYSVETDDIEEWVEASVAKFEELYPKRLYYDPQHAPRKHSSWYAHQGKASGSEVDCQHG